MNEHDETPYIYISPLREMFNRLDGRGNYEGRGTSRQFFTPVNHNAEGTKLRGIKNDMLAGRDIKSTHSLFLRFDDECVDIVSSRKYHLIIDEDLNVATVLSNAAKKGLEDEEYFQDMRQPITKDDLDWLLENGNIRINQNNHNQVEWIKNSDGLNHRYKDVETIIRTGAISLVNEKQKDGRIESAYIIWAFPISILNAFENITILTYRYRSSILKAYLDFHGIQYEHSTVVTDETGLHLAQFDPSIEKGYEYARLIKICDAPKLNAVGVRESLRKQYPLSSAWYGKRENQQQIIQLRNNTYNFIRNYAHADRDRVMWTTFKSYKKRLTPHSYATTTANAETWVQCGCRATEQYADRTCLAYLIDKHLNPGIVHFLGMRNIRIDNDEYALSDALQWIFRSAIRRGNEIELYIPSQRMRNLVNSWLGVA